MIFKKLKTKMIYKITSFSTQRKGWSTWQEEKELFVGIYIYQYYYFIPVALQQTDREAVLKAWLVLEECPTVLAQYAGKASGLTDG